MLLKISFDLATSTMHQFQKGGINDMESVGGSSAEQLVREFENFEEIARGIMPRPGSIPSLIGMEVYGETLPLNGIVGGDHLIYVDFKKRHDLEARIKVAEDAGRPDIAANLDRCRRTAGVALIDVSGHRATDAMLAAMFHQAFLLGVLYELDMSGQVTQRLFENLNQRFYRTSKVDKFITAVYGEISEDASFRFLLAGHPPPIVFSSANDRFMEVDREKCISFPPLGTFPSKSVVDWHRSKSVLGFKEPYEVNKWTLMGSGDILLLYTDGLQEHTRGDDPYFPDRLEQTIRRAKHLSAIDIVHTVLNDLRTFANPADDVSLVVIKKI
jgi:serine phosphatase RsbU (regulator of sigma subunit)